MRPWHIGFLLGVVLAMGGMGFWGIVLVCGAFGVLTAIFDD